MKFFAVFSHFIEGRDFCQENRIKKEAHAGLFFGDSIKE